MEVHPKTLLLSPISVCRPEREVNITVVEHSASFDSDASSVSEASTASSVEVQRSLPQKDHRFFASKSRTSSCRTMTRTRTADRLAAAGNKSTQKNRSEELDGLRQKFDTFRKQFKPFGAALKQYHASLVTLEQNRSEVWIYSSLDICWILLYATARHLTTTCFHSIPVCDCRCSNTLKSLPRERPSLILLARAIKSWWRLLRGPKVTPKSPSRTAVWNDKSRRSTPNTPNKRKSTALPTSRSGRLW